ncbi:MAG: DUF3800 domain-containing protein [Acutalibacteraceae bacterium]
MNNTTIIFSDEAGQYYQTPNDKQIKSDPFYVRSAVYLSTEDYISFQHSIGSLKQKYNIPFNEEIKWSDIYEIKQGRFRANFLKEIDCEELMAYITEYMSIAYGKDSIKYLFTISGNRKQNRADKDYIIFFHLQNIYQRAQLDANSENSDFYMVIIDDMNESALKNLREKCSSLLHTGDKFLNYPNLNQSLLVEKSEQSAGIQLSDYAAGIFNSVAKKYILSKKSYDYADSLYKKYIASKLRNHNKNISGYGIIRITNKMEIDNLGELFNVTKTYL